MAVCFVVGIALDRWWNLPWTVWLITGLGSLACWVAFQRKKRDLAATVVLLGCCLFLGGARHHFFWSISRSDDIALFTRENSQPVSLTGTIESQPQIYHRKRGRLQSAWMQPDRTLCLIRCQSILVDEGYVPVSGLAQLNVSGHLLHVEPGDEVQIRGWLASPHSPANPGEYDYRDYLRRRGVRSVLYAEYPDAIRRTGPANVWSLRRFTARLRKNAESLFIRHLSIENAPVASALLLGRRSGLDKDLRTEFAASGTMHLLAISGLHVGLLAGLLWLCCRLLNLSPVSMSAVIVVGIVGYAFMTDARPSVVRATIIVVVTILGRPWYRQGSLGHLLAVAALLVLAWNPSDLFDIGAQLSFLSMMAIIWSSSLTIGTRYGQYREDRYGLKRRHNRLLDPLYSAGSWLIQGYKMVGSIWLFSLPLVIAHFHVISPVGLLIGVLLSPLLVLILWSGHTLLFFGFLFPPAAPAAGYVFDFGLTSLLSVVENAAQLSLGHRYTAGPSNWWLAGFYLLLAVSIIFRYIPPIRRWGWRTLCVWFLVGLIAGPFLSKPGGLRCTFLSVGHGVAVLVELPNGKTLLYDAGSLQNGDYAGTTVQNALWHRGLSRIDAVVISHADLDHYNGLPSLLNTVSIGTLLTSPQLINVEGRSIQEVYNGIVAKGVPMEQISQHSRLKMDKTVIMEVLHPHKHAKMSNNNAHSVVLLIEYAGRRILLTRDLEGEGLEELINQHPSRKIDVMLSPHHGSPNANTTELARWARPDFVTVSAGRSRRLSNLQATYGRQSKIFSTAFHGAVTFQIDPGGTLRFSHTHHSGR